MSVGSVGHWTLGRGLHAFDLTSVQVRVQGVDEATEVFRRDSTRVVRQVIADNWVKRTQFRELLATQTAGAQGFITRQSLRLDKKQLLPSQELQQEVPLTGLQAWHECSASLLEVVVQVYSAL